MKKISNYILIMNVRQLDTPLESVELHLNSEDHIYNFNKSHYYFKLKEHITCSKNYLMRLSLKNATIPNSYYNVNTSNNTLIFDYDGTSYTFTADVGNYNIQQLLTSVHTGFTTLTGNNSVQIEWIHQQNKAKFTPAKDLTFNKDSTMLKLLGFSKNNHTCVANNSLLSDNLIDIRLNDVFYIKSNITTNTKSFAKVDKHHNTLAKIPVSAPTFGVNIYEPMNPNQVLIPTRTFDNITIIIINHLGEEMDFNNQLWSMTLEINFYQKPAETLTTFNPQTGQYETTYNELNDAHLSELHDERDIMNDAMLNPNNYNIIFV